MPAQRSVAFSEASIGVGSHGDVSCISTRVRKKPRVKSSNASACSASNHSGPTDEGVIDPSIFSFRKTRCRQDSSTAARKSIDRALMECIIR